ncbi:MAG: hypothetical protein M1838_003525 [Thelocarpon superellum]|nr:MAG: hypothetical protein M1838_003525 [Thelocarpon superellum]
MARRRTKKRTHVGARNGPASAGASSAAMDRSPKSMVLRIGAGEVGPSVSQLVKDVRSMMEPGTASRLKERRSNKLKDYLTMAGPLGVSHLLLFSRSSSGKTNLRLALTPRGPTLHFHVDNYSLCKDVKKSLRHAKGGGKEFLTAPLVPTSEPSTTPAIPKHLESLTTAVFQSLFPAISPQSTPLGSIRRVLLLSRERGSDEPSNGSYTIYLRHYAITTKATGLSRGIRRLKAAEKLIKSREKTQRAVPNLGKLEDVADYLLDPSATAGFTSASESEVETDAEVEVLDTQGRRALTPKQHAQQAQRPATAPNESNTRRHEHSTVEKRAVKLVELGPRMKLRMSKVEEGVCGGKVMWHEYLSKSKEEMEHLEQVWAERRRAKEARRTAQRENVERRRAAAGTRGNRGRAEGKDGEEGGDDEHDEDEEGAWDSEDFDDYDGMEFDGDEGVGLDVDVGGGAGV